MVAEAGASDEKLRILQTLFHAGYQSDVISQTLDKLIALEQEHTRRELAELQARLQAFESQYTMLSEDFYQRYEQGQLDDSADFMEWSSFYDMWKLVHQRLDWLMGKP